MFLLIVLPQPLGIYNLQRKRKREEVKEKAKVYFDHIDKLPRLDHIKSVNVPVGPTFAADTSRFEVVERAVILIQREKLNRKWDAFLEMHRSHPVLYVQGPQGIGKSHLILHKINELRLDTKNRVIYIPGTAVKFLIASHQC